MLGLRFYWRGLTLLDWGECPPEPEVQAGKVIPIRRPPPSFCSVCDSRAPGGFAGQPHHIRTLDRLNDDYCPGVYQLRPKPHAVVSGG